MEPVDVEDSLELSEGVGEAPQDHAPADKEDSLECSIEMLPVASSLPPVKSPPQDPELAHDKELVARPVHLLPLLLPNQSPIKLQPFQ